MSLHHTKDNPPQTTAESLALHLETNYGVQLDPVRHAQLVKELDEYLNPPATLPAEEGA